MTPTPMDPDPLHHRPYRRLDGRPAREEDIALLESLRGPKMNFARVAHRAALDKDLGHAALRVLAVLAVHMGGDDEVGWYSARRLGEDLNMAVDTVRGHLRNLERRGYILKVRWVRDNGSQTSNCIVVVLDRQDAGGGRQSPMAPGT